MNQQELDLVFGALADSTRRGMLAQLAAGEKNISALAQQYSISQPAISRHVRVLERAGLVSCEKRGRESYLRVNTQPLDDAHGWIAYYSQFWKQRFTAVDEYLKNTKKGKDDGA